MDTRGEVCFLPATPCPAGEAEGLRARGSLEATRGDGLPGPAGALACSVGGTHKHGALRGPHFCPLSLSRSLFHFHLSGCRRHTYTPPRLRTPSRAFGGRVTDRPSCDRQSAHAQATHGPRCCVLPPYLHGLRWGLTTIWGPCRASPTACAAWAPGPTRPARTPLLPAPPTALTAPETKTRLSAMPLQTPPNPAHAHQRPRVPFTRPDLGARANLCACSPTPPMGGARGAGGWVPSPACALRVGDRQA